MTPCDNVSTFSSSNVPVERICCYNDDISWTQEAAESKSAFLSEQ